MENIKLNNTLINRFFGGLDSDCLEQVKELVEQGAVLNLKDGNLYLNNLLILRKSYHLSILVLILLD